MKIILNGEPREVGTARLDEALCELGFATAIVATAVNGEFVPIRERAATLLSEADRLEVIAPMQGG